MRRWFKSQPIHRKLVLTSLVKTSVVLFAAMVVLLVRFAFRVVRVPTSGPWLRWWLKTSALL